MRGNKWSLVSFLKKKIKKKWSLVSFSFLLFHGIKKWVPFDSVFLWWGNNPTISGAKWHILVCVGYKEFYTYISAPIITLSLILCSRTKYFINYLFIGGVVKSICIKYLCYACILLLKLSSEFFIYLLTYYNCNNSTKSYQILWYPYRDFIYNPHFF